MAGNIEIINAKVHNLRGIDVTIPRDSLTVVTGLSGSGKSSLAFDTLYAEGQRRYVESLSAYARQFLDRMQKPDVEKIEGLSPAISIEQRTTSGNPRSIVATVTEIHDYLRILYGSIAVAHCPHCGKPVVKQSAEQIVEAIIGGHEVGASRPSLVGTALTPLATADAARFARGIRAVRGRVGDAPLPDADAGRKIIIYAPLVKGKKGRHEEPLAAVKRNGFARVRIDGTIYPVDELPALDKKKAHTIDVVVDRLVIPAEPDAAFKTRLTDSVELALKTGKGILMVGASLRDARGRVGDASLPDAHGHVEDVPLPEATYSELNACPDCGISFDELKARSFSFNSPFGACPTCAGLGQLYYFDEDLVVPDKSLPLEEAIHPWRRMGQMNILYHRELLAQIAKQYKVKLSTPYEKLPAKFRHGLMHGFKEDLVLPWRRVDRPFEGVLASLQRRLDEAEDDEMRAKFEAYQSFRTCPDCGGSRLRPESRAATVAGKSIVEVMAMPVTEALEFFKEFAVGASRPSLVGASLTPLATADAARFARGIRDARGRLGEPSLPDARGRVGDAPLPEPSLPSAKLTGLKDIIVEIVRRLQFLLDVGLDYLTLDRAASTLSGGEMQRIRLATQIGSGLTGVLYVLDEPTIGLHPRDNERLISTLKGLRDRGNTVVVVEHDEEMMRNADYIVDLGPGAGREGGQVMYQGDFKGLLKSKSLTADYLTGRKLVTGNGERIPRAKRVAEGDALAGVPVGARLRRDRGRLGEPSLPDSNPQALKPSNPFSRFLTISGCTEHNLKNITARFPVGAFTVVTGVSGSGKSTLVDETLKRALLQKFYHAKATPGKFKKLAGWENFDKIVEIDQSPIGRTPRSNPATYVGFFSEIRELFAKTESARARGYTAGRFSFNVKGGRCETCGGDGLQKLEMSFLPDVYVTCDQCGGKRFNAETLEVTYGGKNIADVLEMTVAEGCEFFAKVPSLARKLQTLLDVGLGYVALGQSATTLSGGEAQRIKLATELSRRSTGRTLYLLDEPTTGLHFDDVAKLMKLLLRLRDQGNTVIVIEHNVDVMRCADWIVDLGPGGGDAGGELVCEGPISAIKACKSSITGRFL
ncbi:MAG: ATP-binding cassette domain-containing protein [Kiritimatiellae bacterium]|nr:ATP-binding cassette domain-containing protein [Kiritimatiellia bacterium]